MLSILPEAEAEIQDAREWYERQRTSLGDDFVNVVTEALLAIEARPRGFPRLETLTSRFEIRRLRLKRLPYLIVYQIAEETTVVLSVSHVRRRPNYWKKRIRKSPSGE